jgi:predicted nuclease of restriction endonuclease-like (RecB) superfamily
MRKPPVSAPWIAAWTLLLAGFSAWTLAVDASQRGRGRGNQNPADDPFVGVTTDGSVEPGLFSIRATGVSTGPVRDAATRFLSSLTDQQRARTAYAVDDIEWRLWNNVHRYARQGVSFEEMTETQRERGFALMRAGLSARGFQQSRDIMRLNGYLADVLNRFEEYGEFLYHLTVMGVPSDTEPWGWQLDGHHLVVNYFVLGDQVVMTPTFMGSEPVTATTGRFAGASVLQLEERVGLAFMASLTAGQRAAATITPEKTGNNAVAQAFRDNLTLDHTGLRADTLSPAQRAALMDVVEAFVGYMDDGHARVWMEDVRAHLDDTWFAWIGQTGPDDVFYYRVHSPVILVEFDHQMPVALEGPRVPGKVHVHSVVRTPNGNDYGKDLLRQHYDDHDDKPAHGHPHIR